MKRFLSLLPTSLLLAACVDAPVTPDQLEASGRLRHGAQVSFSAVDRSVMKEAAHVSAMLTDAREGELADTQVFTTDVGTVHLHLHTDGLLAERPVIYRWTHGDVAVSVPGSLGPSEGFTLGSSMTIGPAQAGIWTVEVLEQPTSPDQTPHVLVERTFEVRRPKN